MDENDVERTLSVNLDGDPHAVTTAFAPLLGAGGRVINVSSGAGPARRRRWRRADARGARG